MNVVDAAAAGVEHFVCVSFIQFAQSFPLQDANPVVETHIKESGMTYTILRPTFFMEVWLGSHLGFDVANNKATIYRHGVNKIS